MSEDKEKKNPGPKVYFPQNKTEAQAMIRSINNHLDPEDRDPEEK
jgi:hypothetical protein